MDRTAQSQQQAHVLFEYSPLIAWDETDERIHKAYQIFKQLTANKSPKECQDIFLKHVATNLPKNLEDLTYGHLVAILVEQDGQQSIYYRDIVTFSRDLNLFCQYFSHIIVERLSKLRDHSIKQTFWIVNQLIKTGYANAETVCQHLIRQVASSDLSARNLSLVENLLDLLNENRNWLVNSTQFMVPTVIYTFIRLIADHMSPTHSSLRQRETEFVIGLIRERFLDCLAIGRDFIRLLHYIIKIPEFEKLWNDIFNDPRSLHPTFLNPMQFLATRTPRRLIQSRLTFEMEKKISFLATQVKFGNQKRYQDWFHRQYLSTPESLSLRSDLIRYICTIIHPTNEVLCSDIIPRWAIIGWLLTTCTTGVSAINSRLALFFDWLVYDAKVDNIMNIEPAILVMFYSMRSHPNMTASLLDFLCRIPSIFTPKLNEHIRFGIKKSLQQIIEKRVLQSLGPLFDNPKHDLALKNLIRENFSEFCNNNTTNLTTNDNGISQTTMNAPPNQMNHQTGSFNNINNKQAEVVLIEQDKTSSADPQMPTPLVTGIPTTASSITVVGGPLTGSAISVITDPSSTLIKTDPDIYANKASESTFGQADDKLDLNSASSSLSSKDDAKAFSWNGAENTNASYSNKQNHDTKCRKTSVIIQAEIDFNKRHKSDANLDGPVADSNEFKSKDGTNNSQFNPITDNSAYSSAITSRDESNTQTTRVLYPFMTVPEFDFKETINSLDEPIRSVLEDLSIERDNESRCGLMDKLISIVFDNSEKSSNSAMIKNLGHCIAYLIVEDFTTKIFPSSQDNESLEESIATPFFVLCRSTFSCDQTNWTSTPMTLLVAISKFFEAANFLVLYFLRVNNIVNGATVSNKYVDFCNASKRVLSKCLHHDLSMALTYDPNMFAFFIPTVFGEIASSGTITTTGNVDLIRLVVSSIDPINLQELICLCLTGTIKILNKEDIISIIEASLDWESWEQYCLWKFISAQSVPIENYLSILPKLNTKANAEAVACVMLNLRNVSEPTVEMIEQIIDCDCKPNDSSFTTILRYWTIKTDTKELGKKVASLYDSQPPSPQMKRKGQTKTNAKNPSGLSIRNEKILNHLDTIRQRAPKSKLLAQTEIMKMISQIETLCSENQKKRFADLFVTHKMKPFKKQKRMDKELTA